MASRERLPKLKNLALVVATLSAMAVVGKIGYDRSQPPEVQSPQAQISHFFPEGPDHVIRSLVGNPEKLENSGVVFIFYGGGWGNTPLKNKPDWQETLREMKEFLRKRGYKVAVLEDFRREQGWDIILPDRISAAAKKAALKVYLLKNIKPGLKVVLIGESWGASFIGKVKDCLEEMGCGDQVYLIEIGEPLGARRPLDSRRELRIAIEEDHLARGGLISLVKESSPQVFRGHGGDFGIGTLVRVEVSFGTHDGGYTWESIEKQVCLFLERHFPLKQR